MKMVAARLLGDETAPGADVGERWGRPDRSILADVDGD